MKRRKRLISAVAIFLAALMTISVLFMLAPYVSATETSSSIKKGITTLESEAKQLQNRRSALSKEIEANKSKTLSTIEKKSQIDRQIEITRLEIQNTNDQIQAYNLLIADTQKKLDAGLDEQEELNNRYKARIRAMEENGSVSYWSILFNSRNFSDLIDRMSMIGEIAKADQQMLAKIKKNNESIAVLRDEVEADRAKLQAKSAELESLGTTLETQKNSAAELITTLASQQKTLNNNYAAIEAEEAAVRKKIMDEQKRYEAALAEEQRKKLEEANKNNAAGKNTGTSNPKFSSPVPKGSAWVTDAFGYRIHPIYGYYAMHNGVDLAANQGTKVMAIAAGYVTIAQYHSVNGNYVSLTHGNGYGSIYCHLDHYVVKVGDYVAEGQLLGYGGSTGWATGPHLHFEIHKDSKAVNPMNYISLK